MKLVLVGTRKGQPVVNWSGVIATSLLVCAVSVAGSALMSFLLTGVLGFGGALMSAVLLIFTVVIVNVRRALHLPPDELQKLD